MQSPQAHAAHAEQLPEKASNTLNIQGAAWALGGPFRPDRKQIAWERMGNREAILGYTRGQEAAQPCDSCKRQAGPFTT
ncbi:MAG: hypothetical protein M1839_003187, partial [Geoglossum umbratile]